MSNPLFSALGGQQMNQMAQLVADAKRDSMGRYSSRGMSYDDDMSYARGGRGGNRGYSRDDGKAYMMEQLEDMMEDAEKPAEKEALRRCMDALKRA